MPTVLPTAVLPKDYITPKPVLDRHSNPDGVAVKTIHYCFYESPFAATRKEITTLFLVCPLFAWVYMFPVFFSDAL